MGDGANSSEVCKASESSLEFSWGSVHLWTRPRWISKGSPMPLVTAGALSNELKTAPSKPRAVKSNALIPARLFIPPPSSVEAPPPTLHAPYVLKNTFHYTLQLELAATRRTLGLTQQHREIVDGSNPSQRVQGLHSRPAFHGHTPRSPSPICPRPSTSVIRLANVRHSALCPDCNSSLSKDNSAEIRD